mgnify:CR=1 FL=1
MQASSYNKNYYNPSSIINGIDKTVLGGTKVTLINLPIREQALPNNPPLGLALLASQLQRYGVDVNIIDFNSYRIHDSDSKMRQLSNGRVLNDDETYKLLADNFNKYGNQDLIGLSGLITTLDWQAKIAKYIRKVQPDSLLVSGGGLATEFRGILFKGMRDTWKPAGAFLLANIFYSAIHFVKPAKKISIEGTDPLDGILHLIHIFRKKFDVSMHQNLEHQHPQLN